MMLSDDELFDLQKAGCLPLDAHIGPCSVDLRLGNTFTYSRLGHFDNYTLGMEYPTATLKTGLYTLQSQGFVLATTFEKIKVPNTLGAIVHGRSSIGRCGLQVQNAGFIDSGFEGQITLELFNQSKHAIELIAGVRICQISFFQLGTRCRHPYSGKYQNQLGATPSRIHLDNPLLDDSVETKSQDEQVTGI